MSLQEIQNKIEDFISNTRNDSIVIKGNWGVGKTYFWQNLITTALESNSKITNCINLGLKYYAYVSLFGISSSDELKDAILRATIFAKDAKGKYSRLNQFANQLSVSAKKIEPLHKFTGNILTTLAFNDISQTLICFDDIERRTKSLELDYVLGLANYLKEQRGCKIVIILNENSMEEDSKVFRKHIEKVADFELLFAPQPEEAFNYIFSAAFAYFEIIKNDCLKLGIKNLRILKRIKIYIEQLIPLIQKSEAAVTEEVIASVVLFVWAYYDRDSKTPSLEFIKKFSPSGLYIAQNYGEKKVSNEDEEWYQLLGAYNFTHTEEMDNILISFIKEGYLQQERFSKLLDEKNETARANLASKTYGRAWTIYSSSFKGNQEEFANSLTKTFAENAVYLNLRDLQTTVETLREFGLNGSANELIDLYLQNDVPKDEIARFTTNSFND